MSAGVETLAVVASTRWWGADRRELVRNLVGRELKSRYKGSVLGFLWALLTPLLMSAVYVGFLRLLAGRGVALESILIGVFGWQFTAQSVHGGMNCITGNANLVKKVAFPRIILPVAVTAANLIGYLLSLAVQMVLVGILLVHRGEFYPALALALPLVILAHTVFNYGLALLLGSANTYFRDTQHLVGVALSAWFFLSPVMYDLAWVARFAAERPWLEAVYLLNPVAAVLTLYRVLLLPDALMPAGPWIWIGALWPVVLAPLAVVFFRRTQRNFADVL